MNSDCVKMIVLLLILDAVLSYFTDAFIERGKAAAISHGCHSVKCVRWRWWFE